MRLFISHGLDKSVRADMRFLDTLETALTGAGHEVLMDRSQLQAGDTWQAVLHEMLAACDGALLLLSPRALTRPWVLKESTVLAYRKALEPRFPLYPVLLGGVTVADLTDGRFSPLCLEAIQGLQPGDPLQPAAVDAAAARAVAKAVAGRLGAWQQACGGTPPLSPLDRLTQALQARLRRVANPDELRALCTRLTGHPPRWEPGAAGAAGPAWLVAATLVNGLGDQARPGELGDRPLTSLVTDLVQRCGLDRADAALVLDLLTPLWTRPEAAAVLADVAGRNRQPVPAGAKVPPGQSVAMPCQLADFSPDSHVRRVLMPTTRRTVVRTLPGGHSDNRLEELKAQVREEYRRLLQRPGSMAAPLPAAVIDARLGRVGPPLEQEVAVFFVIPDPLPDAALLAELQACFPRQTFILQSLQPLPERLPPRVVALPPIAPDHEWLMAEDCGVARDQLAS